MTEQELRETLDELWAEYEGCDFDAPLQDHSYLLDYIHELEDELAALLRDKSA